MPARILVCIDGEPHSEAAIEHAIRLSLSTQAELTALHVMDPYLKQFYNEMYAQGRKRYLHYIDQSLRNMADAARHKFRDQCRMLGQTARVKIREGEPLQEILDEVQEANPDLLVIGQKQLTAWERFRSNNLPSRLLKLTKSTTRVITVNAS